MIDPDDIERIVAITELDLRTELPTWRDRMTAVAAEVFDAHDAAAVVTRCVELCAPSERPRGTVTEMSGAQLAELVSEAQAGSGPRAGLARRALLSLGSVADERSLRQED